MLKKLPVTLIIIIIYFTTACGKNDLNETEPNNQFHAANTIAANSTLTGKFDDKNDQDIYSLPLVSDSILSIELTRIKGIDSQIIIYQNNKLVKKIDDYKKNEGERIDNVLLKKGLCYIVIASRKIKNFSFQNKSFYPSLEYKVKIQAKSLSYQETEPNDLPKHANTIEIAKPLTGFFSPFKNINEVKKLYTPPFHDKDLSKLRKYDFDWYKLHIPKKGRHNISISLSKVAEVDSAIAIYEKNKRLIFRNDKEIGKAELISNYSVEGKKDYYILVLGHNHYTTSSKKSYSYQLAVNLRSEKHPFIEAEMNDNFDDANSINEGIIHGIVSPKNDLDFYKLEISNDIAVLEEEKDSTTSESSTEVRSFDYSDDRSQKDKKDSEDEELQPEAVPDSQNDSANEDKVFEEIYPDDDEKPDNPSEEESVENDFYLERTLDNPKTDSGSSSGSKTKTKAKSKKTPELNIIIDSKDFDKEVGKKSKNKNTNRKPNKAPVNKDNSRSLDSDYDAREKSETKKKNRNRKQQPGPKQPVSK